MCGYISSDVTTEERVNGGEILALYLKTAKISPFFENFKNMLSFFLSLPLSMSGMWFYAVLFVSKQTHTKEANKKCVKLCPRPPVKIYSLPFTIQSS